MTSTEFSMVARPVPSIKRAPLSTIGLGFVCALARGQITRFTSKALRKAPRIATRQAGLAVVIIGLLITRDTSATRRQRQTYVLWALAPTLSLEIALFRDHNFFGTRDAANVYMPASFSCQTEFTSSSSVLNSSRVFTS